MVLSPNLRAHSCLIPLQRSKKSVEPPLLTDRFTFSLDLEQSDTEWAYHEILQVVRFSCGVLHLRSDGVNDGTVPQMGGLSCLNQYAVARRHVGQRPQCVYRMHPGEPFALVLRKVVSPSHVRDNDAFVARTAE